MLKTLRNHLLFITLIFCCIVLFQYFSFPSLLAVLIFVFSSLLTFQGAFSVFLMIYAWADPQKAEENESPKTFVPPRFSFSALVPARHEEKVLFDTLESITHIDYPESLKEILVICRMDDASTIDEATRVISRFHKKNIKLILFSGEPINKPKGLNVALSEATKDAVVVFDAEDEPNRDIYNVANSLMVKNRADVVQAGVQLMNFTSSWFSVLNVLEYFFWYKSSLQFFARCGMIPLGGNTVFFKRRWLEKVDGWDESCLTEDADIGIRLSTMGAKTRVVYDEIHVTQEETAASVEGFVRQRTRWIQGWLQVLLKGDWLRLPKVSQRVLAFYVLTSPIIQGFMFLYIPFSFFAILSLKLPVVLALYSTLPMYLLLIQLLLYNVGLYEFTKNYNQKYPWWAPIMIFSTFYPFQLILNFSSFRAIVRMIFRKNTWEKTLHINAHRKLLKEKIVYN